jgi:hypothetical protein
VHVKDYQGNPVTLEGDLAQKRVQELIGIMTPEERRATVADIERQLAEQEILINDAKNARDHIKNAGRLPTQEEMRHMKETGDKLRAEKSVIELKIGAMEELIAWNTSSAELRLEPNTCSRLHKLQEAVAIGHLYWPGDHYTARSIHPDVGKNVFVVKHNWADAFAKAEGIEEGHRLPFPICTFEFRLKGKTVITCAMELDPGQAVENNGESHVYAGDFSTIGYASLVELKEAWVGLNTDSREHQYLISQIKAICIALDAEVAVRTVERAPVKLNEKRARAGKPPLKDFHIVDLARRYRVANPLPGTGEPRHRVRLHFRRGHWRHFETSKTWVKWCLVGNPDMGFIAKEYSL